MGFLEQYMMLTPYMQRGVNPAQTQFPSPYSGPRGAGGIPSANPRLPSGGGQGGMTMPTPGAMGLLGNKIGGMFGDNSLGYTGALSADAGLGQLIMNPMGGTADFGLLSGGGYVPTSADWSGLF